MTVPQDVARAGLLGAASGMRTFSAPAALAVHDGLGGDKGRFAILAAAGGELVGDKLPNIPARTQPPALAGRIASGVFCGTRMGGDLGASAGGAAAAASTFASYRGRAALSRRLPLPDAIVGAIEDVVALTLAGVAARGARAHVGSKR